MSTSNGLIDWIEHCGTYKVEPVQLLHAVFKLIEDVRVHKRREQEQFERTLQGFGAVFESCYAFSKRHEHLLDELVQKHWGVRAPEYVKVLDSYAKRMLAYGEKNDWLKGQAVAFLQEVAVKDSAHLWWAVCEDTLYLHVRVGAERIVSRYGHKIDAVQTQKNLDALVRTCEGVCGQLSALEYACTIPCSVHQDGALHQWVLSGYVPFVDQILQNVRVPNIMPHLVDEGMYVLSTMAFEGFLELVQKMKENATEHESVLLSDQQTLSQLLCSAITGACDRRDTWHHDGRRAHSEAAQWVQWCMGQGMVLTATDWFLHYEHDALTGQRQARMGSGYEYLCEKGFESLAGELKSAHEKELLEHLLRAKCTMKKQSL